MLSDFLGHRVHGLVVVRVQRRCRPLEQAVFGQLIYLAYVVLLLTVAFSYFLFPFQLALSGDTGGRLFFDHIPFPLQLSMHKECAPLCHSCCIDELKFFIRILNDEMSYGSL